MLLFWNRWKPLWRETRLDRIKDYEKTLRKSMELYVHSQAGVNGYCKHVGAVVRSSWFCREWFWGHFTQHVMHWKAAGMAMICDLLEYTDYKPVIANKIEQEIAKCHVLIDHDCHRGKQTSGTEFETMSPKWVIPLHVRGKHFAPSWGMNANHLATTFVFHTLFHIPF